MVNFDSISHCIHWLRAGGKMISVIVPCKIFNVCMNYDTNFLAALQDVYGCFLIIPMAK